MIKQQYLLRDKIVSRTPLDGVRLDVMRTSVSDVVFLVGSILGGDSYAPADLPALPQIMTLMFDESTKRRKKDHFHEKLDDLGASVVFSCESVRIRFALSCRKENLSEVFAIFSEMLIEPSFDSVELEVIKERYATELEQLDEDTAFRAETACMQGIYTTEHPNYQYDAKSFIKHVEHITHEDLMRYHEAHIGLGETVLCATGDVDSAVIEPLIRKRFGTWKKTDLVRTAPDTKGKIISGSVPTFLTIPDKANTDVVMGAPVGIDSTHTDFLPLTLGFSVLGGGFFSRLIYEIREKQGLTYRIRATLGGADDLVDGYWRVSAWFAPALLQTGIEKVRKQVDTFIAKGITEKELAMHKETIDGAFKVGFGSARSSASMILTNAERDRDVAYFDAYLKRVRALTQDVVNSAIVSHVGKDYLVIAAGSIDAKGEPL